VCQFGRACSYRDDAAGHGEVQTQTAALERCEENADVPHGVSKVLDRLVPSVVRHAPSVHLELPLLGLADAAEYVQHVDELRVADDLYIGIFIDPLQDLRFDSESLRGRQDFPIHLQPTVDLLAFFGFGAGAASWSIWAWLLAVAVIVDGIKLVNQVLAAFGLCVELPTLVAAMALHPTTSEAALEVLNCFLVSNKITQNGGTVLTAGIAVDMKAACHMWVVWWLSASTAERTGSDGFP
jgi:hypothetical protein